MFSSIAILKAMNRRELLINRMNVLESQGMGCIGCPGTCCTYEANSMLLTPLEAKELFNYLKKEDLLTSEFKSKLEACVSQYRLEPKFQNSKRSYLRKTYTCPFFNHQELGCPLPREIKPYGCLAFDSHHVDLKASEHCYSETDILERRELLHSEEKEINLQLVSELNLQWEKSPIPNALIEFWEKASASDLEQE
jgi:hypothetical protein